MVVILSGPSGVGKTTVSMILEKEGFKRGVSVTSRPKRPGEKDANDYFFVTKEEFLEKIENKDFLEYVEIFGNFYGSSLEFVQKCIERNEKAVMCLSKDGFLAAKKKWGESVVGIYLLPPSSAELEKRLDARNTQNSEKKERLNFDIAEAEGYDYKLEPEASAEMIVEKILQLLLFC